MSVFKFSLGSKTWVVIATLGIIGILFGAYFMLYIPNKENAFIKREFRILSQIASNISERNSDYQKLAETGWYINVDAQKLKGDTESEKERFVSAFEKENLNTGRKISFEPPKINNYVTYGQSLESSIVSRVYAPQDSSDSIYLMVPIQEFINPILRDDAFAELFVVRNNSIIFQTIQNQLNIDTIDHFTTSFDGIEAGNIIKAQISNESYRVFIHRMSFKNHLDGSNEFWYICGLVREDDYRQEIQQVESFILINAAAVLLFILMSMPLLKLLLMSRIERLYTSNVVWIGISLIFGTSILTMLVLSTHGFWELKYSGVDKKLKFLSDKISDSFINELSKNYEMLDLFEDHFKDSFDSISDDTVAHYVSTNKNLPNRIKNEVDFNHLFWTDSAGNITRVFTPIQFDLGDLKNVNITERTYFSDIMKDKEWPLPNEPDKKFVMQSLVSWADNTLELAISKKGNLDFPVVAITSKPHSVMDPVLPPGYGFCLIDKKGLVWFHSDDRKNLQENFLEEINGNNQLRSSLKGNISKHSSIKYLNKWHRAYGRPIANIPLDLVVFHDLEYVKLPVVLSVTTTFFLIGILFFLMAVQLGVFYIFSYKSSKLQVKRFYFDWMAPSRGKKTTYLWLAIGNLLIIIFWLFMGFMSDGSNKLLSLDHFDRVFLASVTTLYILGFNHVLLKYGPKRVSKGPVIVSFSLIVVVNLFYCLYFSRGIGVIALYQLVFILFLIGIGRCINLQIGLSSRAISYKLLYNLFLTSWLLISSSIPVFFFFKLAYNLEQQIWHKYSQLKIVENLQTRNHHLEDEFEDRLEKSTGDEDFTSSFNSCYMNRKKNLGFYFKVLGFQFEKATPEEKQWAATSLDSLLFYIRPSFSPLAAETKAFAFHNASDSSWHWLLDEDQELRFEYKLSNQDKIYVTSQLRASAIYYWQGGYTPLLWLLLVALIPILYFIIDYAVRKIYAQDFADVASSENTISSILQQENGHNRIFLTGLPYTGKWNKIFERKEALKNNGKGYQVIDCRKLSGPRENFGTPETNEVIFIKNFEYNITDHQCLKAKLNLLEEVLLERTKMIIILSEVHPDHILSYYQTMIKKIRHLQFDAAFRGEYQEYRHHYKLWQQILRGFIKIYYPLSIEKVSFCRDDEECNPFKGNEEIKSLLVDELKYGSFLAKLGPQVAIEYNYLVKKNESQDPNNFREDIILRIQSLAESYYRAIWNSFTKAEKYLIFDLAKDNFLNVRNDSAIKTLLRKGIFQYCNGQVSKPEKGQSSGIRLMNKSFNNFVLSVVDRDQEVLMDKELQKKGQWRTIQLVLILTIIGITVFIVLGQKDFLNQFNALVGAVTAVVGLLLRFGGMFTLPRSQG